MPYPILTLPYPFEKRLSQLLSPLELQNLQIAAGHFESPLKPTVLTCNVYIASFNGNTSDFITVGPQKVVKIYNNKVFCKCEYAFFIALSEVVVENYYFNNTHYAANVVTFKHCKVSTKFLENVARKLTKLTELYFEDKCEIDKSIKLPIIFNLFPFCISFAITTAYNGWVRDLVDANILTKIQRFTIEHDDLDELLSFDKDDIRSLLKQHDEIYLSLTYKVHGPTHESNEYFEKRIRETFGLPKRFSNDIYFEVRFVNHPKNSDPIYWCSVDDMSTL